MRITQGMMTRNYLRNMNRNLSNLNKSMEKLNSGQKFSRGSENISASARAMRLRQNKLDEEQYLENISNAQGWLASAESNMSSINEILVTAREKLIGKGLNDPTAQQRENMAQEIDNMKEEVIQFMNSQFSDKYLFGGTNNGAAPFSLGADGRVQYNGISVDDIEKDPTDGKYYYTDPVNGKTLVPENEDVYLDVGLGLTMTGNNVDSRSAFKMSFSGLDILGAGKTDGVSNNVVNLLQDAADVLRTEPFDRTALNNISNNLKEGRDKLNLNVIDIGSRTQFLDKTTERLENDIYNITEMQQKVEVTDQPTEIMNWKMFTAIMMATYQFGSEVLPTSLMDFLR